MSQDFSENCMSYATLIELCVLRDYLIASYNPKNTKRRLHRHSAFFGTVEDCMEDCCAVRPKTYYNNT
jgi:hypothetical protein